jgi:hypothetical protein
MLVEAAVLCGQYGKDERIRDLIQGHKVPSFSLRPEEQRYFLRFQFQNSLGLPIIQTCDGCDLLLREPDSHQEALPFARQCVEVMEKDIRCGERYSHFALLSGCMEDLPVSKAMECVMQELAICALPWIEQGDVREDPGGDTPTASRESLLDPAGKVPAI